MKKIALLVIVSLLIGAFGCLAESIDLSSMDDSSIKDLFEKVQLEMHNRGIPRKGELAEGVYRVGTDIASGSYNILANNSYISYYYIFSSEELYNEYLAFQQKANVWVYTLDVSPDQPLKIDLSDGEVLLVDKGLIVEEVINSFAP